MNNFIRQSLITIFFVFGGGFVGYLLFIADEREIIDLWIELATNPVVYVPAILLLAVGAMIGVRVWRDRDLRNQPYWRDYHK